MEQDRRKTILKITEAILAIVTLAGKLAELAKLDTAMVNNPIIQQDIHYLIWTANLLWNIGIPIMIVVLSRANISRDKQIEELNEKIKSIESSNSIAHLEIRKLKSKNLGTMFD